MKKLTKTKIIFFSRRQNLSRTNWNFRLWLWIGWHFRMIEPRFASSARKTNNTSGLHRSALSYRLRILWREVNHLYPWFCKYSLIQVLPHPESFHKQSDWRFFVPSERHGNTSSPLQDSWIAFWRDWNLASSCEKRVGPKDEIVKSNEWLAAW